MNAGPKRGADRAQARSACFWGISCGSRLAVAVLLLMTPLAACAQGLEHALGAAMAALAAGVLGGLLGLGLLIYHIVARSRASRIALGIFGGLVLLTGLAAGFTDGQEMRMITGTCCLAAFVTLLVAGLVKERPTS